MPRIKRTKKLIYRRKICHGLVSFDKELGVKATHAQLAQVQPSVAVCISLFLIFSLNVIEETFKITMN